MTNSNNLMHNLPASMMRLHWLIRNALLVLMAASVLTLSACSSPGKQDVAYSDMFEVRSYQIETLTNEIVTTCFVLRLAETNTIRNIAKQINLSNFSSQDVSGYDYGVYEALLALDSQNDAVVKESLTTDKEFEFQCLDYSCGFKEK